MKKDPDSLTMCEDENNELMSPDDVPEYYLGKRQPPPPFVSFHDEYEGSELVDQWFWRDLAWAMASGVPSPSNEEQQLPLLGSWTPFKKELS